MKPSHSLVTRLRALRSAITGQPPGRRLDPAFTHSLAPNGYDHAHWFLAAVLAGRHLTCPVHDGHLKSWLCAARLLGRLAPEQALADVDHAIAVADSDAVNREPIDPSRLEIRRAERHYVQHRDLTKTREGFVRALIGAHR